MKSNGIKGKRPSYDKLEQVESLGRRFMADYAPGIVLALYAPPVACTAVEDGPNLTEDGRTRTIYWRPQDGLTALLHEIGHGHTNAPPEPVAPEIKEFFTEMWAWAWAEEMARNENIFFDYRAAEKAFASYVRPLGLPLRIKWKKEG